MDKAEEFELWFPERMGHSDQLKLAHEEIAELQAKIAKLEEALRWAKNDWTSNEPSESVMARFFEELNIK